MPQTDALVMSVGIGMWFGFSFPMFIHIWLRALSSLAQIPGKRPPQKILEGVFRLAGIAIGLFGLAGFAIFQGQINPAKDSVLFGILGGIVAYVAMVKCYKQLTKWKDHSGI